MSAEKPKLFFLTEQGSSAASARASARASAHASAHVCAHASAAHADQTEAGPALVRMTAAAGHKTWHQDSNQCLPGRLQAE